MDNLPDLASLENFQELCDEFALRYKRDPSTLKYYRARFKKYHEFLAAKRGISTLLADKDDIAAYADFLDGEMTPQVKKQYLNALRILYNFLIKRGLFKSDNPLDAYKGGLDAFDVENAKHDHTAERIPQKDKFTDEEIELMLDKVPKIMQVDYLGMVIDVAVNSGIRVKGISKLMLEKFRKDDATGVWYIQLTKGLIAEENDTKTRSQKVPIPEALVQRVKAFVEQRNAAFNAKGITLPTDWQSLVFLSNRAGPLGGDSISHKFTRLMRKVFPRDMILARKLSIHSLRKSFATRKLKEGFSLHEVSKMLGHTRITTTIRYLQLNEQEVLSAYAEKQKEKSLDFLADVETIKTSRKVQKGEEEVVDQQKTIDLQIRDVATALLAGAGPAELARLFQLIGEYTTLRAQLVTPREQKLLEEREILLRRIKQLEEETHFAQERMKQLPNYKLFEKKTKKSLKQQMQDRARELAGPVTLDAKGRRQYLLGLGKIADAINTEFNTAFTRQTIKYWLEKEI